MCDIPFIVWVSEDYKMKDKIFFSKLKNYIDRPYTTQFLIYSVSDLSKLRYKEFNPVYSIFLDKFVNEDRYVYNIIYDDIPHLTKNNKSTYIKNVKLRNNANMSHDKQCIN